MTKQGRPKNINLSKNRLHGVILDETAERIWRRVTQFGERKRWLNDFVSEKIKERFFGADDVGFQIEMLELERSELGRKINHIDSRLKDFQQKQKDVKNGS